MDSAKAMDKETEMLKGHQDRKPLLPLGNQRLKRQILLLGPSKCWRYGNGPHNRCGNGKKMAATSRDIAKCESRSRRNNPLPFFSSSLILCSCILLAKYNWNPCSKRAWMMKFLGVNLLGHRARQGEVNTRFWLCVLRDGGLKGFENRK